MKTCMSDFSEQHTAPEAEDSPDGSINKYLFLPSGSILLYTYFSIPKSWVPGCSSI